ncbi:MAG: DNA methyltransferase, partial [Bacteroidota bacterium]|nr:DNA methyltransferase [Bacteroidota bacterium]
EKQSDETGQLILPPENKKGDNYIKVVPPIRNTNNKRGCWRWGVEKFNREAKKELILKEKKDGTFMFYTKNRLDSNGVKWNKHKNVITGITSVSGTNEIVSIFNDKVFNSPKPSKLLVKLLSIAIKGTGCILDFFAGSGTTGDAVMQLNAEDGGNRKFILCQIDEPINKKKPAYKFCEENGLPPVISSITIERLKRAGEKIAKEIEEENKEAGMFEEHKKQVPDIGYKVFDNVKAPKLEIDDGDIILPEINKDSLSRIYNMVFSVGIDEPTQVPKTVVEDCIYKIGTNYYITNSEKINSDDFSAAIKNGKVFIDGWTASLNGTLQNYKEDVKIVF